MNKRNCNKNITAAHFHVYIKFALKEESAKPVSQSVWQPVEQYISQVGVAMRTRQCGIFRTKWAYLST